MFAKLSKSRRNRQMPTYPLLSFPIVMLSSTGCQIKYLRSRKNNRIKREVLAI